MGELLQLDNSIHRRISRCFICARVYLYEINSRIYYKYTTMYSGPGDTKLFRSICREKVKLCITAVMSTRELEKKIDERVTRDTCVTRAGECRRLDVYRGEPPP